jgi:NADP-dependent 3-hydroxy acid dehydrogenase YdfG
LKEKKTMTTTVATTSSSSSSFAPAIEPHVVFITGASSGIGRHLAYAYADSYHSTYRKLQQKQSSGSSKKALKLVLILTARRIDVLNEIKAELESTFGGSSEKIVTVEVS